MKIKSILLLTTSILLSSCGGNTFVNSYYEGGLGGNQDADSVSKKDATELKNLLDASKYDTKYQLHIVSTVTGSEGDFNVYATPNAWYEDSGETAFGYANEKDTNAIFKYYLNEDKDEVYPSIYEYVGSNEDGTPIKFTNLYNPFSIAHISMLNSVMSTFEAAYISPNRYVLLDDNVISVFQYMSTYGYSLTNAIVAVYVDIINPTNHEFKVTFSLGDYGDVFMTYKKLNETPIDFVNTLVSEGTIKGVDYHEDVHEVLTNITSQNNYVLHGIKMESSVGSTTTAAYTIYCNNDYFLLDHADPNYSDWGYVLVPANKTITYKNYNSSTGTYENVTQTLQYDAFYGFSKDSNGEFYFDFFKGPIETEYTKYRYVTSLPTIGQEGILYILDNGEGVPNVYEWSELSDGSYGYMLYSTWYDTVGDGYINDMSATFYLSSSGLCDIGSYYFEKDNSQDNVYYSKDTSILGTLANGLFGWGFQPTTTWISYVNNSQMTIYKDNNGDINKVDIGLYVRASINGGNMDNQYIYYTMDNFGNASVPEVETFLNGIIK